MNTEISTTAFNPVCRPPNSAHKKLPSGVDFEHSVPVRASATDPNPPSIKTGRYRPIIPRLQPLQQVTAAKLAPETLPHLIEVHDHSEPPLKRTKLANSASKTFKPDGPKSQHISVQSKIHHSQKRHSTKPHSCIVCRSQKRKVRNIYNLSTR